MMEIVNSLITSGEMEMIGFRSRVLTSNLLAFLSVVLVWFLVSPQIVNAAASVFEGISIVIAGTL